MQKRGVKNSLLFYSHNNKTPLVFFALCHSSIDRMKQIKFTDLPKVLPVFQLTGALLLPGGNLPLNIFEPRYLNMVDDALRSNRMIAMMQARDSGQGTLYETGCIGRITSYEETEDGRYLINLHGICRYKIGAEVPTTRGYRSFGYDASDYQHDFDHSEIIFKDKDNFLENLNIYFEKQGMACDDWSVMETINDRRLITLLSMICPFAPREKQALLEANDPNHRAEILCQFLDMECCGDFDCGDKNH